MSPVRTTKPATPLPYGVADSDQIIPKAALDPTLPNSTLDYLNGPPRTPVAGTAVVFTILVEGEPNRQMCPVCREAITSWPIPVTLNEHGALTFETAPARGVGAAMGTACHACNALVHRVGCISRPSTRDPAPGVDPEAWLCLDCLQEVLGLGD